MDENNFVSEIVGKTEKVCVKTPGVHSALFWQTTLFTNPARFKSSAWSIKGVYSATARFTDASSCQNHSIFSKEIFEKYEPPLEKSKSCVICTSAVERYEAKTIS